MSLFMVVSQDPLNSFIPKGKPKMIILGTMVAINARVLDGKKPQGPFFYYNNNRNHFWRVLQHLFESGKEVKRLSIPEKKAFLNKHGIVIQNLVQEIIVPNAEAADPSDTVLFKAHKKKRLKFKKISPKMKKLLASQSAFFTCRNKKGISDLLKGFFEYNDIDTKHLENIWYLPTPTRCNPKARSEMWRQEMEEFRQERGLLGK